MKKFKVEYYGLGARYVHLCLQGKTIEAIFPRVQRLLDELNKRFRKDEESVWFVSRIDEVEEEQKTK